MSLNTIRRIVSGKKARFETEDGLELDLCYVTDRIIICGLPASGVAALYRNDRHDVRRFLSTRYGEKYRIFNFCPRFENEYNAGYFDNRVSRFPFPDHHPPPLALIPLAVRRMHEWLSADQENVMVIHCKAGKGRSETMTCCYLLSLPTLPRAPLLPQNFSKGKAPLPRISFRDGVTSPVSAAASSDNSSRAESPNDSSDNEEAMGSLPRSQSGGAALDLAGHRGERRHRAGKERITRLVENLASSGDEQEQEETDEEHENADHGNTAGAEAQDMADKLQQIFSLHTAQRMKPVKMPSEDEQSEKQNKPYKKPVRGVSIPSQRRFVGYWSRVLIKGDPRPLDLLAPPNPSRLERVRRSAYITEVRVTMPDKMPGFPALINKKRISVRLGRYKTSFVDSLEKKELDLRQMRVLERRATKAGYSNEEESAKLQALRAEWEAWKDDAWEDKAPMFEHEGVLTEQPNEDSDAEEDERDTEAGEYRRLLPKIKENVIDYRIEVDADREVQLKLLVGSTGSRHARLPDVGSLGYCWLIPSFEATTAPDQTKLESTKFTVSFDFKEIDFYKHQSGIQRVEVDIEWGIY